VCTCNIYYHLYSINCPNDLIQPGFVVRLVIIWTCLAIALVWKRDSIDLKDCADVLTQSFSLPKDVKWSVK
jgi:hypothetical protein